MHEFSRIKIIYCVAGAARLPVVICPADRHKARWLKTKSPPRAPDIGNYFSCRATNRCQRAFTNYKSTDVNEAELVRQCKKGEMKSQKQLFDMFSDRPRWTGIWHRLSRSQPVRPVYRKNIEALY